VNDVDPGATVEVRILEALGGVELVVRSAGIPDGLRDAAGGQAGRGRAVPLACPYEGHRAVVSGHERSVKYSPDLRFLEKHLFD
jgi:hypothetical protein